MHTKYLLAASVACLIASPAFAEEPTPHNMSHHSYKPPAEHPVPPPPPAPLQNTTTTANATGVGIANSSSQSGAVAISGQGGAGGKARSSLTINNPANTTSTITQNGRIESVVSGTTTVRSAPGIVAPGLSAAGLETCLGAASGGLSMVGFGATFGTSTPDPGCNARLDARTLWSIGLKKAAVARLCLSGDIYRSMPEVCVQYLPVAASVGITPAGYYEQPMPVSVLADASINGGAVEVIEGKTGRMRMCDNYDAGAQRCRAWTGAPNIKIAAAHPHKRVAAAKPATAPATAAINAAAGIAPVQ